MAQRHNEPIPFPFKPFIVPRTRTPMFARLRSASGARYRRDDARQAGRLPNGAFLDANDGPSVSPQRSRYAPVPALVVLDFVSPEFFVRARKGLAPAAVPETAVNEYRDLSSRPCEIGLARYRPVLAIAFQTRRPQQFRERQFGSRIAARANRGHDPGPNFLRHVVHRAPSPFYRFPYSLRSSALI